MTLKEILNDYHIDDLKINNSNSVITLLNRDYEEVLELQYKLNDFVYKNPNEKIFILTSHPTVLTMGRGLQRDMIEKHQLIEFQNEKFNSDIPVVMVKRGGGMTFHHPGQIVIYPILHLTQNKMRTMELINSIFSLTKNILENQTSIRDLSYDNELLGLWHGQRKIASIGIQLKKFVTLHGLALNVFKDPKLESIFSTIFPCGISGEKYISVDNFDDVEYTSLLNSFREKLLTF